MRTKKTWNDKQGALGLAITAVIVVLIIAVAALAVIVAAGGLGGIPGYTPPLEEGDTEETNPIFAYFDVSARVHFDNTQFSTPAIYGLDGINAVAVTDSSEIATASFFDPLAWLAGQPCDYKVAFKISGPTQADYSYSRTVTGTQQVNSNQFVDTTIPMGSAPGIRYEGGYLVTVTLYDGDGAVVRTMSQTVQVTK